MFIDKIIVALVIGVLFPSFSNAGVGFCFESQLLNGKTINLILLMPNDASEFGSVRYKNGSSDIEIRRISERVESPKKQMPATVQSKWQEQYGGKISGYYYLTTIGANAVDFVYIRSKDKKRFKFFDDRQNPDLNCGWD